MNFLVKAVQRIRVSLVTKLAVSFFLIILISVFSPALLSYFNLASTNHEIQQTLTANEDLRAAENADSFAATFYDSIGDIIKYGQETINFSNNPTSEVYKQAFNGYTFGENNAVQSFKMMVTNAPQMLPSLGLNSFGQEWPDVIQNLDKVINNASTGDPKAVSDAANTWKTYQPSLQNLQDYGKKFEQYTEVNVAKARSNLTNIYARIQTDNNSQQIILIIFSLVLLALAGLLGYVITRSITKPLGSLVRRLEGLAEGDLTARLYLPNQDEFGRVAATFNSSVEKLSRLIQRIQEEADNIGRASSQINRASLGQADSFATQTRTVNDLMEKVESLAAVARDINSSSDEVSGEAQESTDNARSGQEAVRQTVLGILEIRATVDEITKRILDLNEKTQAAGKLVSLIESIAEETHLLALNAAIESAGAGEEGSRFGVVASRVRQLANRTREAVKNTQQILHEIQLAAGSSVMATEQGIKRTAEGVEYAHHSGEANEIILQSVNRTAYLAQSISDSTSIQLQATEDLVVMMRGMTEAISENAFGAQQTTVSAAQLDEVVEQLLQAAREFRLHNDNQQYTKHEKRSRVAVPVETGAFPREATRPLLKSGNL